MWWVDNGEKIAYKKIWCVEKTMLQIIAYFDVFSYVGSFFLKILLKILK